MGSHTKVPDDLCQELPSIPLALVLRHPHKSLSSFQQLHTVEQWRECQWIVLADSQPTDHAPFSTRWARLQKSAAPPLTLAKYETCKDQAHLIQTLEAHGKDQGYLMVDPRSHGHEKRATCILPPFPTAVASFVEIDPQRQVICGLLPNATVEAVYEDSMIPYLTNQAKQASSFRFLRGPGRQIRFLYFLPPLI